MSRQPSTYAVPMTPVTPLWAGNQDIRSVQRQRLLPSAIEMTTPPQTIPRKGPNGMNAPPLPGMAQYAPSDAGLNVPSHIPTNVGIVDVNSMSPQGPLVQSQAFGGNMGSPATQIGNLPMNYSMIDANNTLYPAGPHASPYSMSSNASAAAAAMSGVPPQMTREMQMLLKQQRQHQHHQQQSQQAAAYPTMRNSYFQYYPNNTVPNPRYVDAVAPKVPAGRIAKAKRYGSASMHSADVAAYARSHPVSQMGPPYLAMHPSEASMRSQPSIGPALAANKPKEVDRYSAYNHYILRHAAEEKSKVIWSADVEAAFMEAVWLIPGDECKILMDKRTRGRNELISDYLFYKLRETRSRKQVSSHLQVLKKLLKDDQEFLDYVGPKKIDEDASSDNSPSDPDGKKPKVRVGMTVSSLAQLISKLKQAKRNKRKPGFLLQAEANLQQSHREEARMAAQNHGGSLGDFSGSASQGTQDGRASAHLIHYPQPHTHRQSTSAGSGATSASAGINTPNAPSDSTRGQPGFLYTHPNTAHGVSAHAQAQTHAQTDAEGNVRSHAHSEESITSQLSAQDHSPEVASALDQKSLAQPPLRHPRPVHTKDLEYLNAEPVVVPSASVPPKDLAEVVMSPRRRVPQYGHPTRRHRRTTSTSVDLSGDRVLPVQFKMARANDQEQFIYTRLLRATYESPSRPLELSHLMTKFEDLAQLEANNELADVQVVHATVALNIKAGANDTSAKSIKDQYSSDVQFVVTSGDTMGSTQHHYAVRTVVTSRSTELLRCEMPCLFQRLAGRGLELDKEVVNVPFLPDFWADFLARLNENDSEYAQVALSALSMFQAVYRVTAEREELCFVSLYQFSAAQDEFSARTRFRRVKGVPASNPTSTRESSQITLKSESPDQPVVKNNERMAPPVLKEPSTPTRLNINGQHKLMEQTPKPMGTPALLGLGTPGQALGTLGNLINYESPSMFASPRRLNTIENIELGASPFTAVMTNESRGSPRSSKFEIQRAMTAFEPSAWDEMHDWIYQ